MRPKECLTMIKDAGVAWSEDRAPRMGAAIAYYTLFSLAPLLLIAISIAGAVFGEQAARGEVVTHIEGTVGKTAAEFIQTMLQSADIMDGNTLFIVIGMVVLLLGASGVFAEVQDSLNTIFRVPPSQSGGGLLHTVRRRFLSFAMVLVIGFLLLASVVVSTVLAAVGKFLAPEAVPGGILLWDTVNLGVSLAFVTLLFALLYKLLPDDHLGWGDVWVGSLVTALLFTLGKFLIGFYLGQTSTASAFGAAGSLVVLLVWVYYTAQIFLYGAEFTRLYAERFGSRRGSAAEGGEATAGGPQEAVAGAAR